ncbi:hypothetical protein V2I01_37095 [Micromonospora sp. BRA006-A]|nr:hypothetical protein [Micromonospora sp. BRA006-A]
MLPPHRPAASARYGDGSPSEYQPGVSRWNRCSSRAARSASGAGSAARSLSWTAATTDR